MSVWKYINLETQESKKKHKKTQAKTNALFSANYILHFKVTTPTD